MKFPPLSRWLPALLLLLPLTAHADLLNDINVVARPLNSGLPTEFGSLFLVMVQSLLGIVTIGGIFMIVKAGLELTLRQEDDAITKAKNTIRSIAAALIIINLAPRIAVAFLAYRGGGAGIITTEMLGLLNFFESVAAITAIIFIIVSGIRAVASYGSEDGMTHIKRVVLAVGSGLLLISLKMWVLDAVVIDRTPSGLTTAVSRIVQAVLALGAFVATIVIIYAGLLMVVNIGKDEQYSRAKYLVLRVGIGLIVILTSLAIVRFVIG